MMRIGMAVLGCLLVGVGAGGAQTSPQLPRDAQGPGSADPLAVGKTAMQHEDYAAAHEFFAKYVAENPTETEALFYLGGSDLGLRHPKEAAKEFARVIELMPDSWGAHNNLALAYAESEDWAAFDKERALIKAARDAKKPGLSLEDHDMIDVLYVNGERYVVWYYYKLHGNFKVRYITLHFGKDGRADRWIEAESLDVDQASFQKSHPKEAAAGDRLFTLDTISRTPTGSSQGLMKFYADGEPTYEQYRQDVLAALNRAEKPMATTSKEGDSKKK